MKTYLKPIISAFMSLLLMLVSIAFSTTLVLNLRPLYYAGIGELAGKHNLSAAQIKENYDALIDYNSFFGPDSLKFPHIPSSENALVHFEEVKTIFLSFQLALIIGIVVSVLLILLYKKLYGTCEYLIAGGIITISVPFILALFIYTNFNKVFITFHKIAFNNDYWIFNAKTDPIITFLPESFFMLCAVCIVGIVFLLGIVMIILYFKKRKYIHNKSMS